MKIQEKLSTFVFTETKSTGSMFELLVYFSFWHYLFHFSEVIFWTKCSRFSYWSSTGCGHYLAV